MAPHAPGSPAFANVVPERRQRHPIEPLPAPLMPTDTLLRKLSRPPVVARASKSTSASADASHICRRRQFVEREGKRMEIKTFKDMYIAELQELASVVRQIGECLPHVAQAASHPASSASFSTIGTTPRCKKSGSN